MPKWIDLNDPSGAKLKLASINVQGEPVLHIFITNLSTLNPKWSRAIREMSFNASNNKYLVRRVEPNEQLFPQTFQGVFPAASLREMPQESYLLATGTSSTKSKEERAVEVDMRGVVRLGRNEDGNEVFNTLSGRFFRSDKGDRIVESESQKHHLFLRAMPVGKPLPDGKELNEALLRVSMGFVKAMDMGEVQHSEDYSSFKKAVFPADIPAEADELLSAAIDGALLRYVRAQHDVALEAYSPMARLYDFLPPYKGSRRGDGAIPAPLNIAAQRLLGDTVGKTVLFPNAFDGASFAFLPEGTTIRAYRGHDGVVDLSDFSSQRHGVSWMGKYTPASEVGSNALFFNADPTLDEQGARQDYRDAMQSLRSLASGARAILVLAADDASGAGRVGAESTRFLEALGGRYSIEDVFETAPVLSQKSGGTKGFRVFSLRNVQAEDVAGQKDRIRAWVDSGLPVLSSWDQVKSHVDETIHRIDVKEAESQSIDLARAAANESYQRPYLAFSKVGEARTMSPANLQGSSQAYMTRMQAVYGSVDGFIEKQLGMGMKTLEANFSPEQVDGIAVMISRYLVGRSSILADDTGIGKGRQLAGVATWANKQGNDVVFVTDRANLFSDLARDLKHIGEWDRFRPLVMNSDGEITYEESPGAEPTVLSKGTTPSEMNSIMERGLSMADLQRNIVFLTYSQISNEESAKALWLKNQLGNALVIFDEAHIAAGSDSNIALQVSEIALLAKHVQFASATWAKTHDNMHIYQRAFPQSVAVGTLAETMRKGGDSFSEIFSTMLSAEGALIRREHDLSKLEVEMVIDERMRARNESVSDRVADVLGSASFISGEMQQVFIRSNADSVRRLRGARDARAASVRAKLFSHSFGSGSVIYQVMKAVQGSLNATHVAELAIDSVSKGMKPVIVSDATGESLVEALIEEMMKNVAGSARPEFIPIPTLRDMLRHVILKRLSTVRVEDVSAADIAQDDAEREYEPALVGDDVAEDDLDAGAAPQETQAETAAEAQATQLPAGENDAETGERLAGEATDQVRPRQAAMVAVDVAQAYAAATAATSTAVAVVAGDGDLEDESERKSSKRRKRIFKDMLISELSDMPVQAKEKYAEGLKELEEKIQAVPDIPVIGFDVIAQMLRDAGISVGEISGRKNTLVRDDIMEGMWKIVPRAKSKKAVKATIRSFNNGGTQAVIINRSAATGVSMHSSPRFLDHSRRHLIEHQIPEDPVSRIQLIGRVNRFDQLSSPLITTASTGIFGEVRYLMMQNRKLARMSANVRSSRDNAMSLKGVTDLFNIVGKQAVQGFLQDNALIAKRLGITDQEVEKHPEIVNRLTMHIPLLLVKQQELVYNELYSRVDEILLRAELDGENPLRPNEMDIRAKTESQLMFFGDDSPADEFTSAFDEPVIAKRLAWEQDRNPISYTAVLEAAKVNVERLRETGYLVIPDATADVTGTAVNAQQSRRGFYGISARAVARGPSIQPQVAPALLERIVNGYKGITRLAHMATEAESYEEAMVNFAAARRSYLKYVWIKENLRWLVPGTRIGTTNSADSAATNDLDEQLTGGQGWNATIITDVKPPTKDEDLLDPGKWKITVVTTGEEKPQTYTLRSVMSVMDGGVGKGEVTGDLLYTLFGPYCARGLFTGDQETLRTQFELAFRGRKQYKAVALTGNMYLAAEWAAATKKGQPAIYTDEAGQRHRVVMLSGDLQDMDPQYLPVRLSDPEMIMSFLMQVNEFAPRVMPGVAIVDGVATVDPAQAKIHTLDTTFKSALANVDGANNKRDAILAIAPQKMIAISCSPKDVRRIRKALFSGQVGIRRKLLGVSAVTTDDEAHVIVRSHVTKKDIAKLPEEIQRSMSLVGGLSAASRNVFDALVLRESDAKESKVAIVSLVTTSPEKTRRAIELICRFSGLELYASTRELKETARATIREILGNRRTSMRALQEQMMAERVSSSVPTPQNDEPPSTNVDDTQELETNCPA